MRANKLIITSTHPTKESFLFCCLTPPQSGAEEPALDPGPSPSKQNALREAEIVPLIEHSLLACCKQPHRRGKHPWAGPKGKEIYSLFSFIIHGFFFVNDLCN